MKVAKYLADGKIIGFFQNSAEFGPRALGNSSILCKPYPREMKDYLNLRVKFRENFRPFAPAVLEEDYSKYFDINCLFFIKSTNSFSLRFSLIKIVFLFLPLT